MPGRLSSTDIKPLMGNMAAYLASEAAAKVSRIAVVIVMARILEPVHIGIAAAALATADLLKSLSENGVLQKLVAVPEDMLEASCTTANRINWAWCGGLFCLQCVVAAIAFACRAPSSRSRFAASILR